jgi:prophage regulatory protein
MSKTEQRGAEDRAGARAGYEAKLAATTGKPSKVLRQHEVCDRSGFARNTIWKKVRAGEFPSPLDLGGGRIGWLEHEIEAWLQSRPRASWAPQAIAA